MHPCMHDIMAYETGINTHKYTGSDEPLCKERDEVRVTEKREMYGFWMAGGK